MAAGRLGAHAMPLRDGTFADNDKNSATAYSGAGVWSFSQPVTQATRIAGVPKLTLDAATQSPRATLVGLLYDVDATGVARLISRGASAVKGDTHVSFELYPRTGRSPPAIAWACSSSAPTRPGGPRRTASRT